MAGVFRTGNLRSFVSCFLLWNVLQLCLCARRRDVRILAVGCQNDLHTGMPASRDDLSSSLLAPWITFPNFLPFLLLSQPAEECA